MTHKEYVKACLTYGVPKYQIGQQVWMVDQQRPLMVHILSIFRNEEIPLVPKNWVYESTDHDVAMENITECSL